MAVRERAKNTFLWVALAFKSLDVEKIIGEKALGHIQEIPAGLLELYGHMMTKIETRKSAVLACKKVLTVSSFAYRPVSLSELASLTGLSSDETEEAVVICSSFLSTEKRTVKLIHQTAKEYLSRKEFELDGDRAVHGHAVMARYAINSLSKLRRNICGLQEFGFRDVDSTPLDGDDVDEHVDNSPLAPMTYSCIYWADHLASLGDMPQRTAELTELMVNAAFVFLEEHILHWLESLSLLRKLSNGLKSIRNLLQIARVCHDSLTNFQPLSNVTTSHN
jgi:hypothetical protein